MEFEEYEELVLEHAHYERLAIQYFELYIATFGDLVIELFDKKITAIEKKKAIAFCQKAVNNGELINATELDEHLLKVMKSFRDNYNAMQEEYQDINEAGFASDAEVTKVKAIYRKIAKKIHPDINPNLYADPDDTTFSDFWDEVVNAYHSNDILKISNLEVIINKELKDRDVDVDNIIVDDMEERAEFLKIAIENIKNSNPYLYKFVLEDREAIEQRKRDLEKDIEDYTKYIEELNKVLQRLMINGVEVEWNPDLQ